MSFVWPKSIDGPRGNGDYVLGLPLPAPVPRGMDCQSLVCDLDDTMSPEELARWKQYLDKLNACSRPSVIGGDSDI